MFSKQFMSLRRFSGFALTFLFLVACFCAGAQAQTAPTAIASFATQVNHGSGSTALTGVGGIANIAIDSFGDVLAVDDTSGALYEFPAGNGVYQTLVPSGGLVGTGSSSSIVTPGIAIDSSNNLYIEGGTCILMYPYDTATGTWDGLAAFTSKNPSSSACGTAPPTFSNLGTGVQTWGIAIGNTSSPSLLVGTSQTTGNGIASIAVTGAWTAPVAGAVTSIITGLQGAAISIAEDPAGNIYFVEQGKSALSGVYKIPAGQTGLTSDSGLKPIDPNLPQVTGVTADSAGNIYISDLQRGVFLLPSGFTSSSAAILLTPVYAQGSVGVTANSGYLFVPTAPSPVTTKPWEGIADVAEVAFNAAAFGAQTVGASKPAQEIVSFSFNASETPGTIEVLEAGSSNPDFSIVSGNSADCTTGTLYSAQSYCSVTLTFAPNKAGAVSGTLAMLDAKGNLLASIPLAGIGTSAAVLVSPALQSTIGGGLMTPSQMAVDAAGNLYVADAGLKAVEMYPAGSASGATGKSVGTGLTAPIGVAVDGAGDVFIADSGSIYEVPETASGLNAKGQVTLKTGLNLGSNVLLAADSLGNLFVSDINNQKVYELENFSAGWNTSLPGVLSSQVVTFAGSAFSSPSAIAVDSNDNLYVVNNGGEVWEVTPSGTQTQVLSGLPGLSGMAIDPSGSVYVAEIGAGTFRIPNEKGTLNKADETPVGVGVTVPLSVVQDDLGNVYVVDGSALNINETSASAFIDFGTLTADPYPAPSAGSSTSETATVLNYGNAPLIVGPPHPTAAQASSTPTTLTFGLNNSGGVNGLIGNTINTTGYAPAGYNVTNSLIIASSSTSVTVASTANPGPQTTEGSAVIVGGYLNTSDFSETSDTCSAGPIAVNSTCTMTITFSAGIGDGGALTGEVLVQGNVANSPVGVDGTGVAPTLAGTATAITVATAGSVEGVPVTITVAPNPANSLPLTGNVTLTIIPGSNVPLTSPFPILSITMPTTNGTAQFNPAGLTFGTYTFIAKYDGDATYIYEHSVIPGSATVSTAVPVTITQPNPLELTPVGFPPIPLESYTLPCTAGSGSSCTTSYNYGQPSGNPSGYLILGGTGQGGGGAQPYDGSANDWLTYDYSASVAPTAPGFPMVGLAVYNYSEPTPAISGFNYGTVNYEMAGGSSLCGSEAGSASIINVNDLGAAPLLVQCGAISTSNGTIPDIMTYYSVTPVYTGLYNDLNPVNTNPNYTQATGSTFAIWALRSPMVQLSSNPAALTVAAGSSASTTVTISSVLGYGYAGRNSTINNYSLPLDLQCQGLPAYATCSFAYPTPSASDPTFIADPVGLECASSTAAAPAYCALDIGPAPGTVKGYSQNHGKSTTTPCDASDGCLGPGMVTMTIQTNVNPNATTSRNAGKSTVALAALFGLGFLGFTFRRRASRFGGFLMIVCLLLCGGAIAGLTACSTKTLGSTSVTGVTPAGSYWVTVTAKETGSMIVIINAGQAGATAKTVYGNGNDMSLPYTINVTVGK